MEICRYSVVHRGHDVRRMWSSFVLTLTMTMLSGLFERDVRSFEIVLLSQR